MRKKSEDKLLELIDLQKNIDDKIEQQISESEEDLRKAIHDIKDLEQNPEEHLAISARVADIVTGFVGSWPFFWINLVWFVLWIVYSIEPFPYGLLTMIVSLEAIFLSTLVMISQNRQGEKDRQRSELTLKKASLDLRINNLSEYKIAEIEKQLLEIRQILWHIHENELRSRFVKPGSEEKKK
ncbi:MAG TPA: DUF1003 domain-containing protein [Candidatus Nanoarchaeia archaeon]|nr:DUF1003 domain-containing protein [Candidatus Nanoarchaeia archaeon]